MTTGESQQWIYVIRFAVQKKEAECPKVEVVQEEEEVVHEDNEWGELQITNPAICITSVRLDFLTARHVQSLYKY